MEEESFDKVFSDEHSFDFDSAYLFSNDELFTGRYNNCSRRFYIKNYQPQIEQSDWSILTEHGRSRSKMKN